MGYDCQWGFTKSGFVLEACGGSWVPMSTNRGIAPLFWVSWVVFLGMGVSGG